MEGENNNQNNNAQNATGQQNNNANQTNNNTNTGNQAIDYDKIQAIVDGRNAKTEDSILKDYFQKQGLSAEEMKTAIIDFKNNKAQKEKEASENNINLQNENTALKAKVLQMQINEVANQCALEIGVDAKTIPYLIKMADLKTVIDDKGEVSKDAVTNALTKVLEDLPQLKSQNSQNNGFTKIGAENNGTQPNQNDILKSIFGG